MTITETFYEEETRMFEGMEMRITYNFIFSKKEYNLRKVTKDVELKMSVRSYKTLKSDDEIELSDVPDDVREKFSDNLLKVAETVSNG
jgi:hypothetical protein